MYDLDVEEGTLTERKVVKVNNSSHICRSLNGKYLYSIADEGVEVFKVEPDGDLTPINKVGIDGMRGCYLSVDQTGKYLFVGGYHDGKVTVVHTHRDGRLGSVMDGVFHKGLGSVAERNFRPHVNCVVPTPKINLSAQWTMHRSGEDLPDHPPQQAVSGGYPPVRQRVRAQAAALQQGRTFCLPAVRAFQHGGRVCLQLRQDTGI